MFMKKKEFYISDSRMRSFLNLLGKYGINFRVCEEYDETTQQNGITVHTHITRFVTYIPVWKISKFYNEIFRRYYSINV